MATKRFNRTLSRQIDATHKALDMLLALPSNRRTKRKIAAMKARLRILEAKIP